MTALRWSRAAQADLIRLHQFLAQYNAQAAARVVQAFVVAAGRLREHPRIGRALPAYAPRDVHSVVVGAYEVRYEIRAEMVVILRVWHAREDR